MHRPVILAAVTLAALAAAFTRGESQPGTAGHDPELTRAASWSQPAVADVRTRLEEALADRRIEPGGEAAAELDEAWQAAAAGRRDLLDVVVQALATEDPRAAAAVQAAGQRGEPDPAWLADPGVGSFVRDAVRLWWGRELVRRDRFDEALPLLVDLDVATAVDPAALLFHRGCCQHWLVIRDGAVESFERLLEREAEIPARYARLARLLRADIAAVEADSLDHIARRMKDVRRRLDLGKAGPETKRVQAGVIESLDKLIEELEQQQQQQGQAGAAGGGGAGGQGGGAGRPMDDSKLARGLGKGEVRKKDLAAGAGWGDLPPHEREAALQQIDREYPPYYREAIEQYFKRLATGAEDGP
ncbi:MAG: hypothetical protein ACKO1M_05330 [Planctomycetota bacterium]